MTIEQIYNVLEVEIQELLFIEYHIYLQNLYMDSLYNYPELIEPKYLPGLLNYEESEPKSFQTSIGFLLQNLSVKPGNTQEILLARQLTEYVSSAKLEYSRSEKNIKEMLLKEGIPTPDLEFGVTINQQTLDMTGVFDQVQIRKSVELVQQPEVRTALIKQAVQYGNFSSQTFHVREVAEQLKAQIKKQFPEVRLLYENLGIVGTGTPYKDWGTDVPFQKKSDDPSLWESEIELSGGDIKFRENQTWNRNWGGRTFPKGELYWEGPNIEVPPGKYRVVLNLTDKTYEFIPLNP